MSTPKENLNLKPSPTGTLLSKNEAAEMLKKNLSMLQEQLSNINSSIENLNTNNPDEYQTKQNYLFQKDLKLKEINKCEVLMINIRDSKEHEPIAPVKQNNEKKPGTGN